MPMTSREMIKLLEKNGFEQIGSNGSHRKLHHSSKNITVIVPYHNKTLKTRTEKAILKQAGLK